jgi:uncharacterized protein YjiK
MKTFFPLIIVSLCATALISCKEKEQQSKRTLTYIGAYAISVPEPSGLDLTFNERGFWTVSDETSTIYRLDNEGNVVQTMKIDGDDLEGITVIDEGKLAVVLERSREIVFIDTSGTELKRKELPFKGEKNSGLEGITYNPENGHFYLLNEKKPSLLIELDDQLEIVSLDTLNFSKDVSGIYYDPSNRILWVLSDENQLIVKTDLNGIAIERLSVSIVQPEGITIDKKGKRIYIVSDKRETLYVYQIN